MNLPDKTFLKKTVTLHESDFDCNGDLKLNRIMQLLQDAATEHAEQLGLGWKAMDGRCMVWMISKIKVVLHRAVGRSTPRFTLYTWPLAPVRFFTDRCFEAVTEQGEPLFSALSQWMIIHRDQRKILPAAVMNEFYHGEYSDVKNDSDGFARVRADEGFSLQYVRDIRRSDLDLNGHVNNTNYVTYAVDALPADARVCAAELAYHKELRCGDRVEILSKQIGDTVEIVGQREETCFTAKLTLLPKN